MFWGRKKRRHQLRQQPFSPEWLGIIRRRVPYFALLSIEDQRELQGHIQVFLSEKNFESCGDLSLTDEIRVTIAAYACILLLHQDTDYYPRLDTVLVYPTAFVMETTLDEYGGIKVQGEEVHSGEAWQQGVVILAWEDVEESHEHSGFNVILHEFAHQLDMENGDGDGFPVIEDADLLAAWSDVFSREYDRLVREVRRGKKTLIDSYGAEDPAEFFAVVTECFFELPVEMRERHYELYGVLSRFYRQDPAALKKRLHKPIQDG